MGAPLEDNENQSNNLIGQLSKFSHLVIISDSCFSGQWVKSLTAAPSLRRKVTVIASSWLLNPSYDTEDGGTFTNAFIRTNKVSPTDIKKNPSPVFASEYPHIFNYPPNMCDRTEWFDPVGIVWNRVD